MAPPCPSLPLSLAGTMPMAFSRETLFLILSRKQDSVNHTSYGQTYQLTKLAS